MYIGGHSELWSSLACLLAGNLAYVWAQVSLTHWPGWKTKQWNTDNTDFMDLHESDAYKHTLYLLPICLMQRSSPNIIGN